MPSEPGSAGAIDTRPTFITYYTVDTPYEEKVEDLLRSLRALQLPYRALPLPDHGDWVSNCAAKPAAIRRLVEEVGLPIVWLDADCTVLRPPTLLLDPVQDHDVAAYVKPDGRVRSGLVYLADTEAARSLLTRWEALCKANPEEWDQVMLDRAISETGCRLRKLPHEYCYLRGLDREPAAPVVVEHLRRRLWNNTATQPPTKPRPHRSGRRRQRRRRGSAPKGGRPEPTQGPPLRSMDALIAGMPKSGTTMLCNVMTRLPHGVILYEPGLERTRLSALCARQLESLGYGGPMTARQVEAWASALPRWGAKEVTVAGIRGVMSRHNPTRVILMLRSPWDAACSMYEMILRVGRNSRSSRMNWMVAAASEVVRLRDTLPPERLVEVRYESFVQNPEYRTAIQEDLGWPQLDGDVGRGLASWLRRPHEANRHNGRISDASLARWSGAVEPERARFARDVLRQCTDYCERFGYEVVPR